MSLADELRNNLYRVDNEDYNDLRQRVTELERLVAIQAGMDAPNNEALDFRAIDDQGRVIQIMSAISLLEEFGIDATFLGMDTNGTPQVWINAANGSMGAAAGAWLLSSLGVAITGVQFLEDHIATVGSYARRMRRGFQEIASMPAYLLELIEDVSGTNLITSNPGAELGDLTGFTAISGTWAASGTNPITGSYSFRCSAASGAGEFDKYSITAGELYRFSFKSCSENRLATNGSVVGTVRWYNATPTLIKSDTIYSGNINSSPRENTALFVAPVGATQAAVRLAISGVSYVPYIVFDDVSMSAVGEYTAVRFDATSIWGLTATAEKNFMLDRGSLVCVPNTPVAAGNTVYFAPHVNTNFVSANAVKYGFYPRSPGVLSKLIFGTTGTQPATGDLTVKVLKNGGDTSVVATCFAGDTYGMFEDAFHSVEFVEGDYITFSIYNAAFTTSTSVTTINVGVDYKS